MKKLCLFLFMFVFSASATYANVDAEYLKVKVYGMYASTNDDCSNMEAVFLDTAPSYATMSATTDFGIGSIGDGTYPCVAIIMSDNIQFSPQADDGDHCTEGEVYTLDVCSIHDIEGEPYTLPDGAGAALSLDSDTGNCTNNEDIVAMWLSTAVTSTDNEQNIFMPPVSGSNATGGLLGSSFVVSGASAASFLVSGDDLIDGSGVHNEDCEHEKPDFSFSQIDS